MQDGEDLDRRRRGRWRIKAGGGGREGDDEEEMMKKRSLLTHILRFREYKYCCL